MKKSVKFVCVWVFLLGNLSTACASPASMTQDTGMMTTALAYSPPPPVETTLPPALPTASTDVPTTKPEPSITPTNTVVPTAATRPAPEQALYFFSLEVYFYGYVYPITWIQNSVQLGQLWPQFAHFADRLLYGTWEEPSKPVLSDLAMQNESYINYESFPSCPVYWYHWSPDDLHLICYAKQDYGPGSIYRLETGTWAAWPYVCDRVAVSPRSGRLASWCPSIEHPDSFAVMEWGGEIWVSPDPPVTILVQTSSDRPYPDWLWGWSKDGEKIAYFDSRGYLTIADALGNPIQKLSINWEGHPMDDMIEWSGNGQRVLVYASGKANRLCPSSNYNDVLYGNPPCWQVVDAQTGEIIWQLSDYVEQSTSRYSSRYSNEFGLASISADGRYLALASIHSTKRELVIIDINTDEVLWISHLYMLPDEMRWGKPPSMSSK